MEKYRKRTFKFCNNEFNRDSRHAEALRARDSSRFKRLSMLRSLNCSDSKSDEIVKEVKEVNRPVSRLEMLFKWKQEKQLKKELEMKAKKKPFCVGSAAVQQSNFNQVSALPKLTSSKQLKEPASKTGTGIPKFQTNIPTTFSKLLCVQAVESQEKIPIRKTENQGSSLYKPTSKKQLNKVVRKTETAVPKTQSGVPLKFPKAQSQKRIPVMKFENQECEESFTSREKYGFKSKSKELGICKKLVENMSQPKEAITNELESTQMDSVVESICEKIQGQIPELLFTCDVSVIRPRPSFAPVDFKFHPPAGLSSIVFDEDPFKILEDCKKIYLSRTSTPSKISEGVPSPDSKNSEGPPLGDTKKSVENPDKSFCKQKLVITENFPECGIIEQSLNTETQVLGYNTATANGKCDLLEKSVTENELQTSEESISEITVIGGCQNGFVKDELIEQFSCIDSPLSTDDSSKIREVIAAESKLMKLEELDKVDVREEPSTTEKKGTGAIRKRTSMLKRRSVLNSITEIPEVDDCLSESPAISTKTVMKENAGVVTPRRSMRLINDALKKCQFGEGILSPVEQQKLKSRRIPRHSLRLIDLNTPDKEIASPSYSNLTADLTKLCLKDNENMSPNDVLIEFDWSPAACAVETKSKKMSLLYTPPEIQKSTRQSIKGDLMSFSPCH